MAEEDLFTQERHLAEQRNQLQRYLVALRKIQGELGSLTYWENTFGAVDQQKRETLQAEQRETKRALKAEFPHVPATVNGIEKAIRTYESALSDVRMLQENQERLSHLEHRPTTQGWNELVREAARRLAPEELPPPQHTAQKRPLRDHYGTDTEPSRQRDEPDRSR